MAAAFEADALIFKTIIYRLDHFIEDDPDNSDAVARAALTLFSVSANKDLRALLGSIPRTAPDKSIKPSVWWTLWGSRKGDEPLSREEALEVAVLSQRTDDVSKETSLRTTLVYDPDRKWSRYALAIARAKGGDAFTPKEWTRKLEQLEAEVVPLIEGILKKPADE